MNPGDLYRWRVGHHTGRAIAIAMAKQAACKGALAIADLTDWTEDAGTLAAVDQLAKRLRRNNCYRAGY